MTNITKNNYLWISPLILFLWGIFSLFFLPIIPLASGFGGDGIFYGKVALNFSNMMGEIDTYHAGRIFPGIFIHYIFLIFKLPLTLSSVLLAYRIYYLIILTTSGFIWVKITKLLNLNSINSWIGFIAVFISYPVLNLYFYYPPMTDGTAFFIAILLIYCYLKPSYVLLFLAAVISFFSWPTGIIMCFSIFIYGKSENICWGLQKKKWIRFLIIFLLLLPLLLLVFVSANIHNIACLFLQLDLNGGVFHKIINFSNFIDKGKNGAYDFIQLFNSILIISYFVWIYWVILKDFDFKRFFKINLEKRVLVKVIIAMLVLFFLVKLKAYISNPLLPTITPFNGYAYPVITLSTRFPLQFLVSHIAYWGPSIFLLIIFFNRVIDYLKSSDLAIMLGLIFTIIFSINAESRAITNFYPFIVFILVKAVDFSKLKYSKFFVVVFIIISLLYSKIWLQIKLPATVYPNTIYDNLDKFPMQWYFMNFGLWINYEMYLLHLLSVIVFGALIYLTIKDNKLAI